ncbi:MAG: thiamine phosphate synthase [Longimicrobiales bacterium]|nr:thiamine phosphate synthase [Longimicrobiales bacterium]
MTTANLRDRLRLIVITDADIAKPRTVLDVVQAAVSAGAPSIQLRDKTAPARELAATGRALLPLTRAAGALLFINDRLDVALAIGADGVHVGPDDIPVAAIRPIVPKRFLIGTSTDDPEEAHRLVSEGADYLGCGTVYRTATKSDAGEAIGIDRLEQVILAVDVPVVGIGGVTVVRSREIADETGAAGVAVIRAVMGAPDPSEAVRALLRPFS